MTYRIIILAAMLLLVPLWGCTAATPTTGSNGDSTAAPTSEEQVGSESASQTPVQASPEEEPETSEQTRIQLPLVTNGEAVADVLAVEASGEPQSYQFSVRVASPDTGCDQYADWWEVVSEDGELLYRRILLHSHVDEQPFERTGGPVEIAPDTVVWVRAHMNADGYGGAVVKGSVQDGFEQVAPPDDFATDLGTEPPLPNGCAF
jgi:hypothetical protein